MRVSDQTFCDLTDRPIDKSTSVGCTLDVGVLHGGRIRTIEEFDIHRRKVPDDDWLGTVYVLLDGESYYSGEEASREGDVVGVELEDPARMRSEFIQRDDLGGRRNQFMCEVERELLWRDSHPVEVEE